MADKLHITPALIQQYLEGKLDDKTMHILEKQALNDPFLAEALEGYSHHAADQQPALLDLQSRLEQRVQGSPEKRGGMTIRWLAAASVLLLIAIGTLVLLNRPEQVVMLSQTPQMHEQKNTPPSPSQGSLSDSDLSKPEKQDSIATAQTLAALENKKPAAKKKAPVARSEEEAPAAAVMQAPAPPSEAAADKASLQLNSARMKSPDPNTRFGSKDTSLTRFRYRPPKDTIFIGRRLKTDTNLLAKPRQEGYIAGEPAKYNDYRKESDYNIISGVVIDSKTGMRIPGVSVTEKGTARRVVTDTSGTYALRVSKRENLELNFASAGYERKDVNVSPFANNKVDVALPAQQKIMIRGIASNRDTIARTYLKPEPEMGGKVYEIYLQSKKYIIAKAEPVNGEVRLSFTVMPDGSLADFKVLKSLGKAADDAAIRIVQEGPKWIPTSDKKKTTVELNVPIVIQ